jgi:argininosuccinate lyase
VRLAESKGQGLEALTLAELREIDPRIEAEALTVLGVDSSVASRTSFGGTAPARVVEAVAAAERRFASIP